MLNLFDFGLLLAYFVPGFIALKGVAFFSSKVRAVVQAGDTGAGHTMALVALALVAGLGVNVVRFSTLDFTFRVDLTKIAWAGVEGPEHRPVYRVDPDYYRLVEEGRLEAYRETKSEDLRIFQFYGNVLVALVLFSFCYTFHPGNEAPARIGKRIGLFCVSVILITWFFYMPARLAFYRYMHEVGMFNALGAVTSASVDAMQPCPA